MKPVSTAKGWRSGWGSGFNTLLCLMCCRYLVSCPAKILCSCVGIGLGLACGVVVWHSGSEIQSYYAILCFTLRVCPTLVFLKELGHFYVFTITPKMSKSSPFHCLSMCSGAFRTGSFCFRVFHIAWLLIFFNGTHLLLRTSFHTLLLGSLLSDLLDTIPSQQLQRPSHYFHSFCHFRKFYFLHFILWFLVTIQNQSRVISTNTKKY